MFKIQGNSFLEILNERAEESLRQALKQGLEQGITCVAKKMIMGNFDFPQIFEMTGLSLQKLYELKAELSDEQAESAAV